MARLGYGVGARTVHYDALLSTQRDHVQAGLAWLEVITENHMAPGGRPRAVLRALRERFPIALHGVSLSLGSTDPLDSAYLSRLEALVAEVEPAVVSDHLCWSSVGGHYAHELLPLPFTEEALDHVASRIAHVQDRLARPLAIENVSTYLQFAHSTIAEWEFLNELVRRTGCLLLLDVNNVFVSAHNLGFSPHAFVDALPTESIAQLHLAGHAEEAALLLDTHDRPVSREVWDLYAYTLRRHGCIATLIEWDEQVPPLERLVEESARAMRLAECVMHER